MKPTSLKRLDSESYRTYRVLRAPTAVADVYKDRIKRYGKHRGALIFPEAILSISCPVYAVLITGGPDNGVHVTIKDFCSELIHAGTGPIDDVEQILEIESAVTRDSDMQAFALTLRRGLGFLKGQFGRDTIAFSSKDYAVNYINKVLGKVANRYL